MSGDKKYYNLKLKDNFYDSEEMKIIESMPNGYEYSTLYLKLCLLSLKGEGKLLFKNRIPYKPDVLATITGHKRAVIEYAINMFVEMEMLSIFDNGTIFINDIQALIGQSSTEAERKKLYRQRIKEEQKLLECGQMSGQTSDISTPEIEIEKEIEIKKERERKRFSPPSYDDIKKYTDEIQATNIDINQFIDFYTSNGWMVGKNKMKDWQATVRNWERREKKNKPETTEEKNKRAIERLKKKLEEKDGKNTMP